MRGVCFALAAGHVVHREEIGTDQGRLTVFDEREPPRVLEQRRGIAGQVVAVLTPAKDQRRAVLGRGDALRVLVEHAERAQSVQPTKHRHQGVHERFAALVVAQLIFEQVADDFRVGLRGEGVAEGNKVALQLGVVFDDAVVDDRQPAVAIEVRVGVGVGHAAVGRPARVAQRGPTARQTRRRLADLADVLFNLQAGAA